ncbi:bacteriohemerythrin [Uliginosibacterium sp. sgz301328]|uniref:bacteriohemerythrin n=1 Tax=Uliginosibacterium sp. sgz301328 TaxID=3243764 RepID=UPI00359E1E09
MAVVRWSEDLRVGNRAIDDDHQALFEMLDRLHDAMRVGQGSSAVGPVLQELVRYTEMHFRREEHYMRQIGYAGYAAHKAEHDRLIREVRELQARCTSGAVTMSLKVHTFLTDWLRNHIMAMDKQLASEIVAVSGGVERARP